MDEQQRLQQQQHMTDQALLVERERERQRMTLLAQQHQQQQMLQQQKLQQHKLRQQQHHHHQQQQQQAQQILEDDNEIMNEDDIQNHLNVLSSSQTQLKQHGIQVKPIREKLLASKSYVDTPLLEGRLPYIKHGTKFRQVEKKDVEYSIKPLFMELCYRQFRKRQNPNKESPSEEEMFEWKQFIETKLLKLKGEKRVIIERNHAPIECLIGEEEDDL